MKIRIHPSFGLYLLCVGVFTSYTICLGMLIALLIHEAGHLIVSCLAGEEIECIELTPFGGIMTYRPGAICRKGIRGICVHAAGPLSNYLILLLSAVPAIQYALDRELMHAIVITNASMLMLNLLPVLPLDGGHIFFCIGYYFFPVAKLTFVLSGLGMLTGLCGIILAIYGILFRGILNSSLLIVGIHILCSAKRCWKTLLAENIYTVVQERMMQRDKIRRIHFYRVSSEIALFELVPVLSRNSSAVCFFTQQSEENHAISEESLYEMLLKTPSATIKEAFGSCKHEENQKLSIFTS